MAPVQDARFEMGVIEQGGAGGGSDVRQSRDPIDSTSADGLPVAQGLYDPALGKGSCWAMLRVQPALRQTSKFLASRLPD